jgi:lipopolysaccharide transport system ATP-binding protein
MAAPSRSEPVLSLRNIAVSYRRRAGMLRWNNYWALKDVNFDLYHGETLAVLGRNGAGKSTLLRVLADIISPDRGTVRRNGCSISLLSLRVGFIPHLTGRENAVLSGLLMGLKRREVERMMDAIIDFSELGEFIDEPVRTYSSGMNARLGFSVALHADPDILLIDEVLGVGDLEFRKKSTQALREKIKSDKTVVLVTHTPQTVRDLCDRAVWIDQGVTRIEGDREEVLAQYVGAS